MLGIDVPGRGHAALEHLVLDLNGTICLDGDVLAGVAESLARLEPVLRAVIVTADTNGTARAVAERLGVDLHIIERGAEGAQKLAFVHALRAETVVALGNGANDAEMLRAAAVGVAVLGGEGTASSAVLAADLVVPDVSTALGLLEHPARLVATLRD